MRLEQQRMSSTTSAEFATAVKFTKLIHLDETTKAGELVGPGVCCREVCRAPAADHQGGEDYRLHVGAKDSEDRPGSSHRRHQDQVQLDPRTKYTWKDFTFDHGTITGWTGK